MRRLRYNVAMSLDGFIADPDGGYDWIVMDEAIDFAALFREFDAFVMGRKTFESIVARLGKPLPRRMNIVLSRTMEPREGVHVIRDLAEMPALLPAGVSTVFLIGGAQLFESLLPRCDELLLTCIEAPHQGDTCFPDFEKSFTLAEVLGRGTGFEFRRYVRRAG